MHTKRKRILIIGATSLIAENCAKLWAENLGPDFILLGRNREKLKSIYLDLHVRNPKSKIEIHCLDFLDTVSIEDIISEIFESGYVDIALIAHGILPNQLECQHNLNLNRESLLINAISPILFAEAISEKMASANHGNLAIIGSVAGDRGRKSNYIYGAAKSLIETYSQGLQHRFAKSNVCITLCKPGPTSTPMTADLKSSPVKLASPFKVAKLITNGIANNKAVIYCPNEWKYIMWALKCLPKFIFHKLDI